MLDSCLPDDENTKIIGFPGLKVGFDAFTIFVSSGITAEILHITDTMSVWLIYELKQVIWVIPIGPP